MYKLLISDLDDTLLDPQKRLSPEFEAFVEELKQKEVGLTIATGRSYQAFKPFLDQLGLDLPYATSNGATIRYKDQVLHSFQMPIGPLRPVIEVAMGMGISVLYVIDGQEYATQATPFTQHQTKDNFSDQIIRPFEDVDWPSLKVDKILLVDDAEETGLERLIALANKLGPNYDYVTFSDWAMDIVAKGVNKGKALEWICDHLGLTCDQCLAAGDNHNDTALLKAAGHGIAVYNAEREVKLAADSIAPAAYGDGVIYEVRRLLNR